MILIKDKLFFSLHLKNIKGTNYGLAKRRVKLSPFFWTIFILDLAVMGTNCAPFVTDLVLRFRGVSFL